MDLMLNLKIILTQFNLIKLGSGVRTNSESLIGVTTFDKVYPFSEGIAIGSIVNIDENRHIEPVKYSEAQGFGVWF